MISRHPRKTAKAHFIGQKGPFGEREVEHPFSLVWEERDLGFLNRPFPRPDLLLIFMAELVPFDLVMPSLEPRLDFLGEAQFRAGELLECLDHRFGIPFFQHAILVKQLANSRRQGAPAPLDPQGVIDRVRDDIDSGRSLFRCLPKQASIARFQVEEDGFHMLAGPESIDAEIDTIAREMALVDIPDFNLISQATRRGDFEIGEYAKVRVQIDNMRRVFFGSESATIDLILIRRSPIMGGW